MKIAIVKLSALGDIVHAMVALQFIKAKLPDCQIDWVVEERFAGVLAGNRHIDHILTVNLKALKRNRLGVFQEIAKVRRYAENEYDLVIDAQGLLKSAITARLIGKRVAGFDKQSIREKAASWFYCDTVACPYGANTIDRNAAVLSQPLGFTISSDDIHNKQPFLFYSDDGSLARFIDHNRKTVVLVIGSTWESRNYPAESYVGVADALAANCLVIWGNGQERQKAEWMASQSSHITVMPQLDLNSLKALLAKADLVIGNDTGPTHMAWGLNRPSITLFGPTPVSRIYQTRINKAIKSASLVNPFKLDKFDYSIREIDAASIIEMASGLLSG